MLESGWWYMFGAPLEDRPSTCVVLLPFDFESGKIWWTVWLFIWLYPCQPRPNLHFQYHEWQCGWQAEATDTSFNLDSSPISTIYQSTARRGNWAARRSMDLRKVSTLEQELLCKGKRASRAVSGSAHESIWSTSLSVFHPLNYRAGHRKHFLVGIERIGVGAVKDVYVSSLFFSFIIIIF